jgi:phospholipid-transporting ATPase
MDASEPFASSGAVPAGFSGPDHKDQSDTMGKGYGRGGDPFDDDEGPSAYSFSAPQAGPYSRAKRGRWSTFKENHLTDVDWTFGVNSLLGRKSKFDGVPREISLNDPAGNKVRGFEKNSVSTGKYGPITFLPKFLFCKLAFLISSSHELTLQPSSPGLPISSSCSRRVSNKCPVYRRQAGIQRLSHLLWSL